jgi:hypothetical protein
MLWWLRTVTTFRLQSLPINMSYLPREGEHEAYLKVARRQNPGATVNVSAAIVTVSGSK